ncbi:MAG TPA: NUDIX hydrolase [Dongiaceae bacterium]
MIAPGAAAFVRPVDAAGLVLLRQGERGLEVLLGRRHGKAGFLPDIYVFPGGRVEPEDALGEPLPMAASVAGHLRATGRRGPSALLRAALREMTEETGLSLPARAIPRIDFICRAITPRFSHRRFHTRFFLGDGALCQGSLKGDGELEDIGWRSLEQAGRLKLVDVTTFVLEEAVRRHRKGVAPGSEPAPRVSYRGDRVRIIRRSG